MYPASQSKPLHSAAAPSTRPRGGRGEAEPSAARACGGDLGGPRRHGGGKAGTGEGGQPTRELGSGAKGGGLGKLGDTDGFRLHENLLFSVAGK